MKLIFVTLSGAIIKLEQPELTLCLFWPERVVFKFRPSGAHVSAAKVIFWPNRMNEQIGTIC